MPKKNPHPDGRVVLDIQRMIDDLGGARAVAAAAGVARTAPYGWVKRRYLSSSVLERLVEAFPELDLNQYFTSNGKR